MGMRNQTRKLTSRSNEYVCAFGLCFAAEVYFELFPGSGMREMRSVSFCLNGPKGQNVFLITRTTEPPSLFTGDIIRCKLAFQPEKVFPNSENCGISGCTCQWLGIANSFEAFNGALKVDCLCPIPSDPGFCSRRLDDCLRSHKFNFRAMNSNSINSTKLTRAPSSGMWTHCGAMGQTTPSLARRPPSLSIQTTKPAYLPWPGKPVFGSGAKFLLKRVRSPKFQPKSQINFKNRFSQFTLTIIFISIHFIY